MWKWQNFHLNPHVFLQEIVNIVIHILVNVTEYSLLKLMSMDFILQHTVYTATCQLVWMTGFLIGPIFNSVNVT